MKDEADYFFSKLRVHIKEPGPRDSSIRRLAFLDISLPLLHDYDVKFFSFMEDVNTRKQFFFLLLDLDTILYNQLAENSLTLHKYMKWNKSIK